MASGGGGNGHFTSSEDYQLEMANIVTSSISMVGSGFIVGSMLFLGFKHSQLDGTWGMLDQLHFKLLLLLATSDIMYSFAMLLGDPDDGSALCTFQAFWSSFFDLSRYANPIPNVRPSYCHDA